MSSIPSQTDAFEGYAWPPSLRDALATESMAVEFDRERLFYLSSLCNREFFTVTFLSREYLALGSLWAACAVRAGVKHFAIGTMDAETADEMQRLNLPHFSVNLSPALASSESFVNRGGFNGKALGIIHCRHKIVMALLGRGVDVICCDIDALIVGSPFSALSNADLAFQRIVHFPKRTAFQWGFSLCGGFVACRASPAILLLVESVTTFQKEVSSDQLAWNLALEAHGVSWNRTALKYADKEELVREFSRSADETINGRLSGLDLRLKALPATIFWRHRFIPVDHSRCLVLHPNSPKSLGGKMEVFAEILGCPASTGISGLVHALEKLSGHGLHK